MDALSKMLFQGNGAIVRQKNVLGTGAINQDTGAGFVDTNNYQAVKALADAGLR